MGASNCLMFMLMEDYLSLIDSSLVSIGPETPLLSSFYVILAI